jgi:SOS-response transcriptional repressor LexA
VLELIKANMNETGMPPTRAEIAQKLGFKSANAAEEHLKALAKKGSSRSCRVRPAASACCSKRTSSLKKTACR